MIKWLRVEYVKEDVAYCEKSLYIFGIKLFSYKYSTSNNRIINNLKTKTKTNVIGF